MLDYQANWCFAPGKYASSALEYDKGLMIY